MALITVNIDDLRGYLELGHYELDLSSEELEKFKKLNREEQLEWIEDEGYIVVDSYDIQECNKLGEIIIYE